MFLDHRPLHDEAPGSGRAGLPSEPQSPSRPRRGLELNARQLVAGALAAASAAFASSWLGVAGTVLGAVVVSLVASVGTALYTHSLERSSQALRETLPLPPRTSRSRPVDVPDATEVFETPPAIPAATGATSGPARRPRRIRWISVAASAVVMLVAGVGILTGMEGLLGRSAASLTGSDNHGTTVGQLFGSGQHAPTQHPHRQQGSARHAPTQNAPTQNAPTQQNPTQQNPTQQNPTQQAPAPHRLAQHVPAPHRLAQHAPALHVPAQHQTTQQTGTTPNAPIRVHTPSSSSGGNATPQAPAATPTTSSGTSPTPVPSPTRTTAATPTDTGSPTATPTTTPTTTVPTGARGPTTP